MGKQMEKWDLYTKYREKSGKDCIRGDVIPEGYYHIAVHVWIRDHKGEYLMSQRAPDRSVCPLMWECVGGAVLKGESSIEGALREVKEEVGLELEEKSGRLLFTKIYDRDARCEYKPSNEIMDVWLFDYDGEPHLESATTREVADCRWMTASEIEKLYEEKKLVPTLDYFFCAMETCVRDAYAAENGTIGSNAAENSAAGRNAAENSATISNAAENSATISDAMRNNVAEYREIIGKTVKGTVDRPMGTAHPRKPEMLYPINYGYVDGMFAGDGAEQDVYVFGTDRPLTHFEGKVIAVYHRFDDVEDKWIVSLDGEDIPDEKILGDISFQEQFFYGKLYR